MLAIVDKTFYLLYNKENELDEKYCITKHGGFYVYKASMGN